MPPSWKTPSSTLLRPMMLATDRSISPVMMISVIGRAISRMGAMSWRRNFTVSGPSKLSTLSVA